MSMSTVGSPQRRRHAEHRLRRSPPRAHRCPAAPRPPACTRRAPAAPGRPTARPVRRGAAGRAVGRPAAQQVVRLPAHHAAEPAGQTTHDRQSRRRRRARAKNTGHGPCPRLYSVGEHCGEAGRHPVPGRRRGGRRPVDRRDRRRPGRRVRPGPHGHPRGREARRRARARRAGPLRGRAGQERPALRRPGVVGQPDLLPDRARLPGHRAGRRQRRRRAGRRARTDQRRAEQARFATTILTSALAPTNFFATNPAAIKRAFDTGGKSLRARRPQLRRRPAPQRRHALDGRPRRVRGRARTSR